MTTCSFCRSAVHRGFAEVQTSGTSFVFVGLSYLILTFSASETYEYDALRPTERVVSYACPKCEAVFLTQEPWIA